MVKILREADKTPVAERGDDAPCDRADDLHACNPLAKPTPQGPRPARKQTPATVGNH